ncbi:MAG: isoprenylcysteine carboxylmethyltransferase family protein [Sphingobium sp.]|nr:isoprenylcysteine carboxylmethyltransferase family protein [Sphingobium sp.]MBP6111902.1 isoprenylcysteine carboxylmethyltransferase family protein [Sphingobium sp.]MBP8670343.1 isoprenylcysteine carboxylmethyltransferase family protein [Sphingobium sp.]MBP9157695.1 isoprenylcysteine carboxylmethyltransferase family protein [Sphingobium sp.]MCC6482850.1 isoprenylcysteine carboxylmethyltransferase family protein [Sphingomonadaceae bacterium]
MKADDDSARVTFPPPLIYLGFLLVGLAADMVLPRSVNGAFQVRTAGAILLAGAGLSMIVIANGLFRKSGTEARPWKTVTALVDTGIYRFTRNPMYVGMALLYAGLALGFASGAALLLLPVVLVIIQTQVIAREERYMEAKFGANYLDYKRRVRRWV